MMIAELMYRSRIATTIRDIYGVEHGSQQPGPIGQRVTAMLLAIAGAGALSGCISVNAPDKPIVIELNMNISLDVVYKLSGDATKTVDTNKDIF